MNTLPQTTTGVPSLHGVLYQEDGRVYLLRQYNPEVTELGIVPGSLSDLCEIVIRMGCSHLWVLPSVDVTPDKAFFQEATARFDLWATWEWEETEDSPLEEGVQNLLVSVTGCRRPKGGQKWFSVIFPAQCQWSWYDDTITAHDLLLTVNTLERALGVVVGAGPTTSGMKLFEKISKSAPAPVPALDTLPLAKASSSLIWEASPMPVTGGYIHKEDKNSAFLRACQEVSMGVGAPVHTNGPIASMSKMPGLWRITLTGAPAPELPPVLWRDAQWVMSPIIKLLDYLKVSYEVHEGFYWQQSVKALKAWAEFLWTKRQELKPVHAGAYEGIKDIAAKTVGLFNSDALLKDYQNPQSKTRWKYRPDYWHMVVAETRAQMFYNIVKYARLSGHYPVMVDIDALFYITQEQDIEQAIPGILDNKQALGGYKHVWSLPIDAEVRAALAIRGINERIGTLNDIAEERGM